MATARYHHPNLRSALLEAGLHLAREGGAAALQVRELAAYEGVSPAAVYRHFPDMAHLTAEVSRLARERLAQTMIDAAAALPPCTDRGMSAIRRLDAIGRAYVGFAAREPHLFDVAFQAPAAPPSSADRPSAWEVLIEALDALVATNELSPELRADAPVFAWSAVHGLASVRARKLVPEPRDDHAALDAIMRGVRRALELRELTDVDGR